MAEQAMGGHLEMTFGPVALRVTSIVYAGFALLFSAGFVRMSRTFLSHAPAAPREG